MNKIEEQANPAAGYAEALARIQAMQAEDDQDLTWDVCVTKLFSHGQPTGHVIVLLHGFTTCPEQFNRLGRDFFEAGCNVLIPRMPYHGRSDRLTDALVHLRAEHLEAFGNRVVDLAHGLGDKITVVGISGSGTLAAWLAQNRADLDYAFLIAPLFGLAFVPAFFTKLFEQLVMRLPGFFMWWDPRTKADNPYSLYYAYPRYPTRALGEFLRLAVRTRSQAKASAPAAGQVVMVLNDAEPAVSNAEALKLLRAWRRHGRGSLSEVHFEHDMQLPHDIITPGTPGVPMEAVNRRLIDAVRSVHGNR